MAPLNLDTDVLRTLVLAQELGGFGRAATRVGRSQSAVSQQIRKIEGQLGETLFRKEGRLLVPTAAGEMLLAYARRILDLNDEAVTTVSKHDVVGRVRVGLPADFAEAWLPMALGRFARAHPGVEIEVVVDRNRLLLDRLDAGGLDLVLALGHGHRADARRLGDLPFQWIVNPRNLPVREPVALVLSDAPCFFRQRALAALEQAGLRWSVSFTSTSVQGIWAAVHAGLGVTLRTTVGVSADLQVLRSSALLPAAAGPPLTVSLHDADRELSPAARQLQSALETVIAERAELHPGA